MGRTTQGSARRRTGAIVLAAFLAALLAMPSAGLPVQARERRDRTLPPAEDFGWGPSVGRNAPAAIGAGLADQGAGWIDTMTNFYADPHVANREYFDYYRRPYGAPARAYRRR